MTVVLYTDASHSYKLNVAACGYVILVGGKVVRHQVLLVAGLSSVILSEDFAITHGIQAAYLIDGVTKIELHTDSKMHVHHLREEYKRSGRIFSTDLKETLLMLKEEGIILEAFHVKGHAGHPINTMVDKSCNRALKKLVAKMPIKF